MLNLNVHSSFDFLNSNITLERLYEKLNSDGQSAVAVTDLNRMHAVYRLMATAPKYGIKPVPGMEIIVEDGMNGVPLVLLAKNHQGYLELVRTSAMLSYRGSARTSLKFLQDTIKNCLLIGKTSEATAILSAMDLPEEDKYISHDSDGDYKKVFIKAAHYVNSNERGSLKVLNAIRDNERLSIDSVQNLEGDACIQTRDMVPEAARVYLKNNKEIINKCEVSIPSVSHTLPKFNNPEGSSSKDYLWQLLMERFEAGNFRDRNEYMERLKYEYGIITGMGFEDYFLIVQDLVNHAKSNGIYVGPGRGSSSASLVSYLLDITEVDPLEYNLLFERFLNPERVSMPDIDIDFEDSRRDEVVEYLIKKYGDMRVANIITYGTLSAKMAARDVGRVFGFSDDELKLVSNLVPDEPNASLEDAFSSSRFNTLLEADRKYKTFMDITLEIEGLPRHTSTHAAGLLLSSETLTNSVPVIFSEGHVMSQWPMKDVEAAGLLKIDLLGLKNLSLIRYMVQSIRRTEKNFSLDDITEDKRVYKMLSKGMTLGIFQLESSGIRRVIESFQPESLKDLAAVLALYRPGPMKEIDNFIYRKEHPETIKYPHEDLKDILKETFGVIVYQEQIMQIAGKIAGFSYGEADILRRAMGKKDRHALTNEREHFIAGAVKKNYTAELAENIFDLIMEFADYGFVKSHAVAYGKVAYTMAYMKLYYPEHFYAVILTHHRGNDEKISQLLTELKMMRIPLLAPDINTSIWQNSQQEGILLGFSMISGISRPLYEALMAARKHGGPFKDIYDLVSRTDFKFNEKILRNLIISGTLDGFEENRKTMLQTLPDILSTVSDGYQHDSFLSSLGFNLKKEYRYSEEMDGAEKIEGEKEALGFYISTHPILLKHRELEFIPFSLIHHKRKHGTYLLYIEDFRTIKVKKTGQNMAFLTLTDGHSNIDGVLFAKEYFKYHPMLKESIVAADATYGIRQGKPQLVIDRLYPADDYVRTYMEKTKKIYIRDVSIDEISELLADSGVPIHDFHTQEFAGYIPISKIETLISNIQVENIRLIV